MTTSAKNKTKKSKTDKKIASYLIDILVVFKSENEIQIPLSDALAALKERFSIKSPPKIQKCVMQIFVQDQQSFSIIIKSKEKKEILETFDINCVGTPSCSQMVIGKYQAQSLVFLPVLNKNNMAELFIFHPHTVSAQEIVIAIAKVLERRAKSNANTLTSKNKENGSIHPVNNNYNGNYSVNTLTSRNRENGSIHPIINNFINSNDHILDERKENNIQDDNKSLCSISSNFINSWYGKLDSINTLQPNSISSLASVHEELHTLNQNLKDIRNFMDHIFRIIHSAVQDKKRKFQDSLYTKTNRTETQLIHLPPKSEFIEVVEKIKTCLNFAATHKEIIINPSSEDIINQLFIFLKIIGDATINQSTGKPELICGIKDPQINSTTVKFLTTNLNIENTKYWAVLGFNYGYMRGSLPNHINRSPIDEFEIRGNSGVLEYEQKNSTIYPLSLQRQYLSNNRRTSVDSIHENELVYPTSAPKNYKFNNQRNSPVPLINNETIYRRIPQMYEPERKAPLFHESQSLQYKNLASRSPHVNYYTHSNNSTWEDRQCRFIDAVQLRNGRIGKVLYDRSVQNYRELGVSCNEVVEILRDYGDVLSVKNALGEIGDCPKAIITEIHNNHSH